MTLNKDVEIKRMDHLEKAGVYTLLNFFGNRPESYAGHSPVGCTAAISDAVLQIAIEKVIMQIRTIKGDTEAQAVNARLGAPE